MSRRAPPRSAVAAIVAARRALLGLADRLVPAHLAVLDKTTGLARTYAIGTIAELGVADELSRGAATAEELAGRLGVDADALHRLLRAAAAEGLMRLDAGGRFTLTRTGRTLASEHPDSMRDWARYFALKSTGAAWADLSETVRTGRSAFRRVHGTSVWEWFSNHPEEERLFAGGMRRITEGDARFVVAHYPWPEEGVICDVAGGAGQLLEAVLRERPNLRGVLVDAKGVLATAEERLRGAGMSGRIALVEGDIFGSLGARADVYLLKNILHDWDDDACVRILATVRATMPAGSRLLVVESLQERNEPDPFASLSDLQMLTQCEQGRERSAGELRALLAGAGLRPGAVRRTGGPALIEAHA